MKWKHVNVIVKDNLDFFQLFRYWCEKLEITEDTMLKIIFWFYFTTLGVNGTKHLVRCVEFYSSDLRRIIGVSWSGNINIVEFKTVGIDDNLSFKLSIYYSDISNRNRLILWIHQKKIKEKGFNQSLSFFFLSLFFLQIH